MAKESVGYKLKVGTDEAKQGIKQLNKELNNTKMSVEQVGKAITKAFNSDTSIVGFIKSLKGLMEMMMKASEAEAEYVESMNLLAVSYHADTEEGERLYNQTNKLLDSMKNLLGLDPSKLTQQVGIYKQMTSAMGMTNETSALLAENLIKLQQDTASLYNLQSSEVATKFQSALAGQTRAVRSLGVDITQATLQQELYNLGIDKSIGDLNRASKSVLIYLAMQRQLSNANGDASRTINSMANQMKIFKEQVAIAGRQIGAVFIPILQRILPIANAILMVFNDIMEIILGFFGVNVQSMAKEFGVKTVDIGEGLGGVASNADKATKATKKLLGLRGFDKLNNITTPQDAGGSGGGGVSGGGVKGLGDVDSKLLDALSEYDLHLDEIQNKAREIADWIEKWLIYTDETGKHLTPLGKTLVWIAGAMVLGKILSTIGNIFSVLSKIGKLGGGSGFLSSTWKAIKNIAKDGNEAMTIGEKLKAVFVGGAISIGGDIWLGSLITQTREANKEMKSLYSTWEFWTSSLMSVAGGAVAGGAVGGVPGALIGAIAGAFGAITTELVTGLGPLTTYEKELENMRKETEKYCEEIDKERDAVIRNRDAKLKQIDTTKDYVTQLKNITDENGKVNKGQEDNAKFIVGQLNKAYGTHLEYVNGVIKGYDTEIGKIEDLIKQKKAKIWLDAQEELYTNAVKKEVELRSKLYYAQEQYNAVAREYLPLKEEQERLTARYNELQSKGIALTNEEAKEWASVGEQIDKNAVRLKELEGPYNDAKKAQDDLTNEYKKSVTDIDKYQKMWVAFSNKNYKEVERIATQNGWNVAEAMRNCLREQIDMLEPGSPLTTAILSGYRELANESEEEYAKGLKELPAETALELDRVIQKLNTSDLADHFGRLSQTSEEKFLKYLKQYPSDVQREVIDKMQEKGYKISEKLQKGIDSLNIKAKVGIDLPSDSWFAKAKRAIQNGLSGIKIDTTSSSTKKKAKGGFVNEGELFVAREAGPEMVGVMNGKTAVANNDQIVNGITQGVMVGVARAMKNTGTSKVVIEADADTQGLMNFISFKQKERDRQYDI